MRHRFHVKVLLLAVGVGALVAAVPPNYLDYGLAAGISAVAASAYRYWIRADSRIVQSIPVFLLWAAFWLAVLAPLAHIAVNALLYDSMLDAAEYHNHATSIANEWRSLTLPNAGRGLPGTGFVDLFLGTVYVVVPDSIQAGALIFSLCSLVGRLLFLRVILDFVSGRALSVLGGCLLLLPSLVYWPAIPGKDALMVLFLGLAAYSTAKIVAFSRKHVLLLVVGLLGAVLVRPHMGAIMALSVLTSLSVIAFSIVQVPVSLRARGWVSTVIGLVLAALAFSFAARQLLEYANIDKSLVAGLESFALSRASVDYGGGSSFNNTPVLTLGRNPIEVLLASLHAVVTAVLRPFPYEAPNLPGLLHSVESLGLAILLGLQVTGRGVLRAGFHPLLWLSVAFTVQYSVAMSFVNNFGVIVRQRVQVIPFLILLAAIVASNKGFEVGNQKVSGRRDHMPVRVRSKDGVTRWRA